MFCHNCGEQNQDTARYCKKCGTQLQTGGNLPVYVTPPMNRTVDHKNNRKENKKIFYIIGAIVIVLAVILAIVIGIRSKKAKEYDTYLVSADKYIENLDYEQAADFYLKAIEVAPKELEPYVKLAKVYMKKGDVEKVQSIMKQAENIKAKGNDEVQAEFNEIVEMLEEAKDAVEYQWVVEPTIEADDIYYVAELDDFGEYYGDKPLNDNYRQIYSKYAVIKKEDALGLIDLNGNVITGLEFKAITGYGDDTYMLIRKTPIWEPEYQMEWDIYWMHEDQLHADVGVGDFSATAFYYHNGLHEIYDYSEYTETEAREPEVPIPVKQSEEIYYDNEDAYGYEWWGHLPGNYGIYHKGEMKTDFIFEECGSYSDGLMAVCRDGKWGYVNEEGEVIIPLEYDASWSQFDLEWDDIMDKQGVRDYCYTATDGYVVLCKDGMWELRDTTGKLALPSGIFEAIRPVYDGKCWVKQAGKWGVIELLEKNEDSDVSQEDSHIFEEMPSDFVFSSGAGGWATEMTVNHDGSFSGKYYDSDMGDTGDNYSNGTMYISDFKGQFSEPEKLDEYTYKMKLDYIETEKNPGETYYEDEWKYIAAAPYGFEGAEELYIYLPGSNIYDLPVEVSDWIRLWITEENTTLPEGQYVIYNPEGPVFMSRM